MGLDQYLTARKFISGYSFDENSGEYHSLIKLLGFNDGEIQSSAPSANVELTVAYWRKENQIHNWFVKNCQDGIDECQKTYVEREKLKELRDLCQSVIETKDTSKLETTSGFFFGSTDYDEWYFKGLEDTVKQLDSILNNPKFDNNWSFYYQSSW